MAKVEQVRRSSWGWLAALAVGVTVVLYGRSLSLPFYSDDIVQLAWLRDLSLGELWTQVSPYDYYRPLAFSLWVIVRGLGLSLTPMILRMFNLAFHALAAVLVGRLAEKLDSERHILPGVVATGLFASYPFAYQAVPWVSAIFYPLVVVLTVGAVLTYQRWQVRCQLGWLIVSVILAGLAPFVHETGVLSGAVVGLIEISRWMRGKESQGKQPTLEPLPLIHIGLNVVFLVVWFGVRKGGVSTLDVSPRALFENLTILIMGLTYPVMPLVQAFNLPRVAGVWGLSVLVVGGLVWSIWKRWDLLLLWGGWFVLSIGPVLVTMRPDWLADAPRFLYPAGIVAAMWWSAGFMRIVDMMPSQLTYRIGGLTVGLILVAGPAGMFVWQGVDWHLRGGVAIQTAVDMAKKHPDERLLLINLPDRLAANEPIYPYFDGGAILLPPQVPMGELTGLHRDRDEAWTIGRILAPVDYQRTTYGNVLEGDGIEDMVETGGRVYVADYTMSPITIRYAGQRFADLALEQGTKPLAYFGLRYVLWDSEIEAEDGLLRLTLIWELAAPAEYQGATVFVHVVDEAGAVVAQGDGLPIMGLYRPGVGDEYLALEDVRYIMLPGEGPYTIYVGMWEPTSGERLPVRGGDFADGRVPIGVIE